MDNLSEQCEEIEALNSIYNEAWKTELEPNSYSIQITENITLYITLHSDYPSNCPPKFELLAPTLSIHQKNQIFKEFAEIYNTNGRTPIIYQWIEKLKEIVDETCNINNNSQDKINILIGENQEKLSALPIKETQFKIIHGDIIQDRKSIFQGHVSEVYCQEDTKLILNCLLENRKIAQATHNISAYRILNSGGIISQNCDDDGETHAGSRLLHLLQSLKLTNIIVVVSRWYGGIHLGPNRFKHINNAARQVLVQGGFVTL